MASPKQTLSFLHFTIILTTLTSFVLALVLPESLPSELQALDIFTELATDPVSMSSVATDFGKLSTSVPAAVFYPSSPKDIAKLIHFSYTSTKPFTVSPRGVGHSINCQTFAPDGIIVNMLSLGHGHYESSTIVTEGPFPYADAGGEQHWIDVLNATLKHGLMPRILTDYLCATVGGTLSNAGIGGQAFRQGPQISNVYELDVITGTGEIVTCSRDREPDLFYGALGGLGQFGVITRARIALEPAKKMARWVRLIYTDVKLFTSDQEKRISIEKSSSGFDYVEGQVILSEAQGPIYLLEGAAYYDDSTVTIVDGNVKSLLEQLNYESGFAFSRDVPLVDFLDRVHYEETVLRRNFGLASGGRPMERGKKAIGKATGKAIPVRTKRFLVKDNQGWTTVVRKPVFPTNRKRGWSYSRALTTSFLPRTTSKRKHTSGKKNEAGGNIAAHYNDPKGKRPAEVAALPTAQEVQNGFEEGRALEDSLCKKQEARDSHLRRSNRLSKANQKFKLFCDRKQKAED
ncbi:Cytokinin oxidase/dehydrogenase [Rhynchospora pubera]|uniref:cytokinin dehydrogenase n=1 Tax=Rhynchospora pubera TaxID=906938 RepID=A0AAV8FDU8_9POAL|nr:Cytokinin oxidase/dehydrogenase [Rhynchospora pubera]